jgi:hypothetical protein
MLIVDLLIAYSAESHSPSHQSGATVDIIADSDWAHDVARKMDIFVFLIYIKNS